MKTLILVFLFVASSVQAQELTFDEKISQLGKLIEHDETFYRWQSTESGENLARVGHLTEALDRRFMSVDPKNAAGTGLYFAKQPGSAQEYLPEHGGNLLEVKLSRGTRLIDLDDANVLGKLKELELAPNDLKNYTGKLPVVLKYDRFRNWYVGKNLSGRVNFQMYPGPEHSTEQVFESIRNLRLENKRQAIQQIIKQRPAMALEILPRFPADEVNLSFFPEHMLPEYIARKLHAGAEPADMSHIVNFLESHPSATRAVIANAKVYSQLADKASDLVAVDRSLLGSPIFHSIPEGYQKTQAVKAFIEERFEKFGHSGNTEYLKEILPFLDPSKPELAKSIPVYGLKYAELSMTPNAANYKLITELFEKQNLRGPEYDKVRAEFEETYRKQLAFERVAETMHPDDIRAALLAAKTKEEFRQIEKSLWNRFKGTTPEEQSRFRQAIAEATRGYVQEGGGDALRLMALMRLSDSSVFPAAYKEALKMNSSDRGIFIGDCLRSAECVPQLTHAIESDSGQLLSGLGRNLANLAESVQSPQDQRALTKLFARVADPEALKHLSGEINEYGGDDLKAALKAGIQLRASVPATGSCMSEIIKLVGG